MHIDWPNIYKWIVVWILQAFPYFKSGMETTKLATDTVDSVRKMFPLIKRGDDEPIGDDEIELPPDYAAERVHAAADLLRSYAFFGLLETIVWIAKMTFTYLLIARYIDYMLRKYAGDK